MDRVMLGFRRDDEGDWVALLDCGHTQHVRHRPPFQLRPWVLDEEGRRSRLGAQLECPLCDRAEMPEDLEFVRSSEVWDYSSVPAALRRNHRLAAGTWGCIRVGDGRLTFVADGPGWSIGDRVDLGPGSSQAVPPGMTHHVECSPTVGFHIDFYRVRPPGSGEGGEAACLAPLVCQECGAVVDRPGSHRPGCSAGDSRPGQPVEC